MRWSDLPLQPAPRMLRQFAGLWILFFGVLAWLAVNRGDQLRAEFFAALAVTIGPLGLMFPAVIRPVFVAWLVLAFPIGWVVSRVLLIALFFGLMLPVGLLFRLMKRDALLLRRQSGLATYWTPKEQAAGISSYFRQY